MLREKRGITLIALVVTIIVLLILAAVSISAITGENGIMSKVKKAQEETEAAKLKEAFELKLAEAQIDMMVSDDPTTMLESLGDFVQGIYRMDVNIDGNINTGVLNSIEMKIKGIFKNESEFVKGTLIITGDGENMTDGNIPVSSMEFEDVKKTSSIDDLSQVLMKLTGNDDEIEVIDSNSSITTVKYKEKLYDIYTVFSQTRVSMFVQEKEELNIADKEWKNVFTSQDYVIAQDADNKLWIWNDVTSYSMEDIIPMSLNGIYPELAELDIADAIYQYDRWGDKNIVGFIEANGNIQLFNDGSFGNELFVCLNEEYPEHLSGIKAKEVYPVETEGFDAFGPVYTSEIARYDNAFIVLDKDGKVWSISYDIALEAFSGYCLNDNLTNLDGVKFDKIVISHMYTEEAYFEPSDAEIDYLTILGIDKNDNLWKIQYSDYDETNNSFLSDYRFIAKNISTEQSLGTVKDVTINASRKYAFVIDSNDKLYAYSFVYITDSISEVASDISVKEWRADRFIDYDGNIYSADGTSINEEYTNVKIEKIYDFGYVLDANGNIWEAGWYTYGDLIFENVQNTNFKKISNSEYVFAAIDSDNNLLLDNFKIR